MKTMKTMKKILIGTMVMLCFMANISYSFADWVSITDIDVIDTRNITATLDMDVDADKLTKEEIKIMHDIVVSSVELDIADAKKATVFLASELRQNTKYNLISVFGMDGSMDFEIGSSLEAEEIMNMADEGIKSINIIDSKNIEIVYFDAITTNELELKLLEDMNIESIQTESNSSVDIKTTSDLEKENNYIFMLLSVVWLEWADIEVEDGIYDFETWADIAIASSQVVEEVEEVIEESVVIIEDDTQNEEVFGEAEANTEVLGEWSEEENEADLNAAAEWDENLSLEKNIDEVAAAATEVPSTWTATSILVLLTLWATALVWLRRRK